MSLPLDEPLHAKFLRRPYTYGLAALFQCSALAQRVSMGLGVALAIVYLFWSGTIGEGLWANGGEGWSDRYVQWGDYPGFWLGFYWHPDVRTLLADHEYLNTLQATTPLGIKGLYFLAAQLQIPFELFHAGLISLLAMGIAGLSCSLTLSLLPVPLAGVMASFLSLQSLWSDHIPLVPDPKTWGYLGLLLCFSALNYRGANPDPIPRLQDTFLTPISPGSENLRGLTWLKGLHWSVLISIIFLALFSPIYLLLIFGVFSLQTIERLAIVPVGRKAQTVQEFLEWSKKQYSHAQPHTLGNPQDHNPRARSRRRKKQKKQQVEWQFQFRSPRLWDLYFPSLGLILGIGLLYGVINHWGTIVLSRADMLQQPAFDGEGIWSYFYHNPWQTWLSGIHSGFIPPLSPPLLWSGLVLPLWLGSWGPGPLPLLRQVKSNLSLLGELCLVSLIGFIFAHAFILQLGWPQDLVWVSHRLGLTIATSIFLTAIGDGVAQALGRSRQRWWAIALALVTLVIIFRFPFINLTPPANVLPTLSSEILSSETLSSKTLYDCLRADPSPKILISTLGFRDTLAPEERQRLDLLQTIAPVYFTPMTLTPYRKSTYENQRQQLRELLQAEYLGSRADVLAFVDRLTVQTQGEPLWLVEQQRFTPENWSQYGLLHYLYPNLSRQIDKKLNNPGAPQGFLRTIVSSPTSAPEDTCRFHSGDWIILNLSKRCLPR